MIEPIIQFIGALFLFSFGWRSLLGLLIAIGVACGLILLRPPGANSLWALGSGVRISAELAAALALRFERAQTERVTALRAKRS